MKLFSPPTPRICLYIALLHPFVCATSCRLCFHYVPVGSQAHIIVLPSCSFHTTGLASASAVPEWRQTLPTPIKPQRHASLRDYRADERDRGATEPYHLPTATTMNPAWAALCDRRLREFNNHQTSSLHAPLNSKIITFLSFFLSQINYGSLISLQG